MQTILQIIQEGRRVAPRPVSQDRQPAVHGACHRGDGRVRPDGTSCYLSCSLWRTERRCSCATRRCASSLALLEERISPRSTSATTIWCGAVEPQSSCGNYVPPDCFARAAPAFRKDMGQQSAIAGFRRGFHGQVHSPASPLLLERNARRVPLRDLHPQPLERSLSSWKPPSSTPPNTATFLLLC